MTVTRKGPLEQDVKLLEKEYSRHDGTCRAVYKVNQEFVDVFKDHMKNRGWTILSTVTPNRFDDVEVRCVRRDNGNDTAA